MAPADQLNSPVAPVPLVHWTSATLDTFQVFNHIFFSILATGPLLFSVRIHFSYAYPVCFFSYHSNLSKALPTPRDCAWIFYLMVLTIFPRFFSVASPVLFSIYLSSLSWSVYLVFVISSARRIMPGKCVCVCGVRAGEGYGRKGFSKNWTKERSNDLARYSFSYTRRTKYFPHSDC